MEHPDLWAIALEALEEHERPEVRAWLAGVVIQPGQTERLARGERDVVFLLPKRMVLVRPDPYWVGSYAKDRVTSILIVAGHVQFEVTNDDSFEFWVDTEETPVKPFREEAEAWLRPTTSGPGLGFFALSLVLIISLLLAFAPLFESENDQLSTNSTCDDFLSAGVDAQIDLLKRLFWQAGQPEETDDPATLATSRRACGDNGTATVDSLIGGK
ncbi:hypothetical protein [Lentzea sp. NPDC051838]|uniref:hypothetical protein n=1 Tax=Lentzea sp. NPDC051838 TaxID=3154849 RepID=UPI00343399B8